MSEPSVKADGSDKKSAGGKNYIINKNFTCA